MQMNLSTVVDGSVLQLKEQPTSATGEHFAKSNMK
jgi:hypothetical protein